MNAAVKGQQFEYPAVDLLKYRGYLDGHGGERLKTANAPEVVDNKMQLLYHAVIDNAKRI